MAKRRLSADSIASRIDWNLCFYCQMRTSENLICPGSVKRKNHDSKSTYEKIANNIEKFEGINQSPISIQFVAVDKGTLAEDLIQNNGKFHKSCSNKFSDLKLERAEKRFRMNQSEEGSVSTGDTVTEQNPQPSSSRRTSSRSIEPNIVQVSKCFFCDKTEGSLRKAMTFELEKRVRKCASILNDNVLLGKLSSGDLIAQEAVYHPTCLLSLYRTSRKKEEDEGTHENDSSKQIHGQVLAELAQYMEQEMNKGNHVFKLVDLADLYKERVQELGGRISGRVHTTKLKQRLLAHVDNLREYSDKKFLYLTFEENVGTVLKNCYRKTYDDEAFVLSEAAKLLRRDILSNPSMDFNGSFIEDCQKKFVPASVKSFVDAVIQGNRINESSLGLEQATLTISQLMIQNSIIRIRQDQETTKNRRSTCRESPIGIYLGSMVHAKTRKRAVVEKLYDIGLSISYDRVMDLSTKMGNRVLEHFEENQLVCPPILKRNLFTSAALDNIDHDPSSTTAEDSFHGTGISLFQHHTSEQSGFGSDYFSGPLPEKKKLSNLPDSYTDIRPISKFNDRPEIKDYSTTVFDETFDDSSEQEIRY